MKLKKYGEAKADFDDVIAADPENSEAYNNRGWCKKRLGNKEGACEDWKTSKKLGNSEAKIILKNNGC
jgi:Flp pilus assembly protein TadD